MKLTIERGALLKALAHVQGVVERRNTIPILSNVQLGAEAGRLSLTATDLDIAVVEAIGAEIDQPGGTTAPAHTLFDIVRKLPEGAQVQLTHTDNRLAVKAGRSTFALACLPRDDFPVMAEGDAPVSFQVSALDLKRMIDRVRFAISTEETRYYLNGIYLHATEEKGVKLLRAVATDGHRLARIDLPLPAGAAALQGVIVPRKTVGELRKLLDEASGEVTIGVGESKIRFAFGDVVLTSKLIDATYPEYERVIPTQNDKLLEVEAKPFATAVDRVSTISSDKSRAVKLSLEKDRVTLSATSPENGSATEEVAATYPAKALEIGFNSRYLMDIAAQIDGDTARFLLADAGAPTVIRDAGDDSVLYVLMPMRV
jgi:DNA polymerase-3 subunit beta